MRLVPCIKPPPCQGKAGCAHPPPTRSRVDRINYSGCISCTAISSCLDVVSHVGCLLASGVLPLHPQQACCHPAPSCFGAPMGLGLTCPRCGTQSRIPVSVALWPTVTTLSHIPSMLPSHSSHEVPGAVRMPAPDAVDEMLCCVVPAGVWPAVKRASHLPAECLSRHCWCPPHAGARCC